MVQNYLKFLALYFWARPENSKKKRNLVTVGGTEGRGTEGYFDCDLYPDTLQFYNRC